MHAASEPAESNAVKLKAVQARLNPGLMSAMSRGGDSLAVTNREAPVLGVVSVIAADGRYTVELSRGEDPVDLAADDDPDEAARRVNRLLATAPAKT